jgi:uncharacterized SAM-binding protein YcdF (DUF218 family)
MPPTIFIVSCLAGGLIGLRHPRIGLKIALVSSILLYILATPAASKILLRQFLTSPPANMNFKAAQAIVVFAADIRLRDRSAKSETVGLLTLDRLAAAAQLYRLLHLPIVVSGGQMPHAKVSSASLMRDELEQRFLAPVLFLEETSLTTYENAAYTSRFLTKEGYNTIIIVIQQRDIPRALWSFSQFGIHALPYSTEYLSNELEIGDFFPSANSFAESYYIFHEIVGLIYYKMFYP